MFNTKIENTPSGSSSRSKDEVVRAGASASSESRSTEAKEPIAVKYPPRVKVVADATYRAPRSGREQLSQDEKDRQFEQDKGRVAMALTAASVAMDGPLAPIGALAGVGADILSGESKGAIAFNAALSAVPVIGAGKDGQRAFRAISRTLAPMAERLNLPLKLLEDIPSPATLLASVAGERAQALITKLNLPADVTKWGEAQWERYFARGAKDGPYLESGDGALALLERAGSVSDLKDVRRAGDFSRITQEGVGTAVGSVTGSLRELEAVADTKGAASAMGRGLTKALVNTFGEEVGRLAAIVTDVSRATARSASDDVFEQARKAGLDQRIAGTLERQFEAMQEIDLSKLSSESRTDLLRNVSQQLEVVKKQLSGTAQNGKRIPANSEAAVALRDGLRDLANRISDTME